jgi:hypothetical protein
LIVLLEQVSVLPDLVSDANAKAAERAFAEFRWDRDTLYQKFVDDGTWKDKLSEVLGPRYETFPVRKGSGSRKSRMFSPADGAARVGNDADGDDGGVGSACASGGCDLNDFL